MQTGIALSARRLLGLRRVEADWIYLGSEFCPNLLPSAAEFSRALAAYPGRIALATPFLTDRGLSRVAELLRRVPAGAGLPLIVNDAGLLSLAAARFAARVELAAGRILADILAASPDAYLARYFAEHGVRRVETDSPQTLARYARFPALACTRHVPRAYAAVTRFCPWEREWVGRACGRSCEGKIRRLESRRLPRALALSGCGYFTEAQPRLDDRRIDRVVRHPGAW